MELTPEMIKQLAELETMRLVLIILLFLVVVLGMFVAAVIMIVRQQGKQVDISTRNSDRLAVQTDALQDQAAALKAIATDNTRKMTLIEENVGLGKQTNAGLEGIKQTLHDSGIRNLKELLGDEDRGVKGIGTLLVEGLDKVAVTLDRLHQDAGTRDTRTIDALSAVEKQVANMNTLIAQVLKPPPVETPTPALVEPPVEPGETKAPAA
jgi:hypothetical protein